MTYYDILEVSQTASEEVIRASYRSLAKKYHPDTFHGEPCIADEKMKQLNEAKEVLCDPEKRRQYDSTLRNQQSQTNIYAYAAAENRYPVQTKRKTGTVQEQSPARSKPPVHNDPQKPENKKKPTVGLISIAIAFFILILSIGSGSNSNGWVEEDGKTYYYMDGERAKGLVAVMHESASTGSYPVYYGFDKETGELLTGLVPAERLVNLFGEALFADEITVKLRENGAFEYERWVWSNVQTQWAKGGTEPSPYFDDYSIIPDFQAKNVVYLQLEAEGLEPVEDGELRMECYNREGEYWGSGENRFKVYWSSGSDSAIQYDPQLQRAVVEINREEPDSEYWDREQFIQETGRAYPENVNAVKFYFSIPETEDGYNATSAQHSSIWISKLIQRHENHYESALIDMMESAQKRQDMEQEVSYKGPMEAVHHTEGGSSYSVYYGYDKHTGELLTGRIPAERFVELGGDSLLADEITVVLDEEGKWEYEEWVFSDLDIVRPWESEEEEPWEHGHFMDLPYGYGSNLEYILFEITGVKFPKNTRNAHWEIAYRETNPADPENAWRSGSTWYDEETDTLYAEIDFRAKEEYRRSIDIFALIYAKVSSDEREIFGLQSEIGDIKIKKMVQHRTQYDGILSDANR